METQSPPQPPAEHTESVEQQAIELAEHASSSSNLAQFEKAADMLSESVNLIQKSESTVGTLDDTLEPVPRPDAQVRAAEATLQKLRRTNKKNAQALKHDRMLRAQQLRQQKLQPLPSAGELVANTRSARKKVPQPNQQQQLTTWLPQAEEVKAANKLQKFLDQLSDQPLDKWKPTAGVPATADAALLPETVRAFHSAHIARHEAKAADAEIQRITRSASLAASRMAPSGGNTGVKAAASGAASVAHAARIHTAREVTRASTVEKPAAATKASNIEQQLRDADARFAKLMHEKTPVVHKKTPVVHSSSLGESASISNQQSASSIAQQLKKADARFGKLMHNKQHRAASLAESDTKIKKSPTRSAKKSKKAKQKSLHAAAQHVGMQLMPAEEALSSWRQIQKHPASNKRRPAASIQQQRLAEQQKKLAALRHSTKKLRKLIDPAVQTSSQLAKVAAVKARRLETAAAIARIQAEDRRSKVPDDANNAPKESHSKQPSSKNNLNQKDLVTN